MTPYLCKELCNVIPMFAIKSYMNVIRLTILTCLRKFEKHPYWKHACGC